MKLVASGYPPAWGQNPLANAPQKLPGQPLQQPVPPQALHPRPPQAPQIFPIPSPPFPLPPNRPPPFRQPDPLEHPSLQPYGSQHMSQPSQQTSQHTSPPQQVSQHCFPPPSIRFPAQPMVAKLSMATQTKICFIRIPPDCKTGVARKSLIGKRESNPSHCCSDALRGVPGESNLVKLVSAEEPVESNKSIELPATVLARRCG